MTTNPLSRGRLELTLERLDSAWHGYPHLKETIQAALSFLLNPEPTEEMKAAGLNAEKYLHAEGVFRCMISALTRENDNG